MNMYFHGKSVLKTALLLSGLGIYSGCAHAPQQTKTDFPKSDQSYSEQAESNAITNQAANRVGANYFVEISFQPGSNELKQAAMESIDALIDRAYQTGKTPDVMVLAWSDKAYPADSQDGLSKEQRDLAEKRNKTIKDYIKTAHGAHVKTYNMAEPPNLLQRTFRTSDSKLKQALVEAGLPTNPTDDRYLSKASHAVIFVRTE